MKTNIGSVANNVQIGRGGSIISDSTDESISVKSSKSADLVDFYAKNLHASRVSVDYADIKNFNLESIDFAKNIYPLTNMQMALNTELRFPWKISLKLNNFYKDLYIGHNSAVYTIDISALDPQQLAGIYYDKNPDAEDGISEEVITLPQSSFDDFKIFVENNLGSKATVTYTSSTLTFSFNGIIPNTFKLLGYGYESVSANNLLNCLESEPNGFGLMNSRYISNCILGYSILPTLLNNKIFLNQNSILKISDGTVYNNIRVVPPTNYLKSIVIITDPDIAQSLTLPTLNNGSKYQVVWNEDIKAIELIDQTKFFFETKSNLLSSLPTDGSYLYARIQKLNYNYKFNTSTNQWEISHFCKFGNLEVDNSGNKSFYPEYPVNFNPMDLQEQLNNASVKKYVKTFTAENFSNNKLSIPAGEHNLGLDCALVYARKKVVESRTGGPPKYRVYTTTYYKDTFVQFYIDTNGNVTIEAEPFEGKLVLQIV